jgi:hypothetical protein
LPTGIGKACATDVSSLPDQARHAELIDELKEPCLVGERSHWKFCKRLATSNESACERRN